jgi:hypothetical protein
VVILLRRSPVGTLLPKLCEALQMFAARAEAATVLLAPAMRLISRVNALVAIAFCADSAAAHTHDVSTPIWLKHLQVLWSSYMELTALFDST